MSEDPRSTRFAPLPDSDRIQPDIAVVNTFDKFREVTHESIAIRPNIELAAIVHDFGDGLINQEIPQIAMMTMIGDRLHDRIASTNAKRALSEYKKYVEPEIYEYTTSILSDMPVINQYAETLFKEWTNPHVEPDKALRDALDRPHTDVERRLWNATPGLPRLDKLLALVEDVNLESIIIKASAALQKLNDPTTHDDELLQTAFVVESTYAPLCEILGLDAFAATLLNRTYSIRLEKSGRGDVLSSAKNTLARLGNPEEVRDYVASLPGLIIGDSDHEPVIDNSSGHETYFSMAYSEIDSEQYKGLVRVLMRIKSAGSLARKIEKAGRIPADLVGITVITEKTEEVGPAFATILSKLQGMENVAFVPAPSRDKSLHVKGSQEFYDSIIAEMDTLLEHENDEEKLIDKRLHDGGFEVAKFTLEWHWTDASGTEQILPIEVQFMHELSRSQSRIGIDAHTLFKYFKLSDADRDGPEYQVALEKAVSHLGAIHDRKNYMNSHDLALNGISKRRGTTLRHDIELLEHRTPTTGVTAIGRGASDSARGLHGWLRRRGNRGKM